MIDKVTSKERTVTNFLGHIKLEKPKHDKERRPLIWINKFYKRLN